MSNIRAINVPSNYELQILSSLVSNVTLYGPAAEIEELSADSIVCANRLPELEPDRRQPATIAVSIQIPSSSRIFATGSYNRPVRGPRRNNAQCRRGQVCPPRNGGAINQ